MKKNTFIPEAMRGVCFECGARGHFGRDCPVRKANDGRRGKKRVRFNPEEDVAEAAEVDEGLEYYLSQFDECDEETFYIDQELYAEAYPGLQIRGSKFRSSSSKFRELELANFTGLVLGCIEAKFCK